MTGDQIITLCLGIGNLVVSILVVVLSLVFFNRREKIYLKRQDAIYDALAFLDKYLSWLIFSAEDGPAILPVRDLADSTTTMTIEGRKIYNRLICSCKNDEIIDVFLSLFFSDGNTLENYNKFRNLCRKELGMKCIKELSKDRIFLSKITTVELEKHSNA